MRISIISGDTYVYRENIARVANTKETGSAKKTEATSKTDSEDFEALLKKIQDKIEQANNASLTGIGQPPTESSLAIANAGTTGTETVVDVNKTSPDYVSIAPDSLRQIYEKAANTYGMDQKLLELIGYHESRFQTDATSKSGAMGVMQLMPSTAKAMGVDDAYDPEQNIMGAAKLLRQLSDAYNGELNLILSAYSAGMNAVSKYGGIPPYEETQNYVKWINERYP